jgi:hypothetical protein
MTHLLGLNSSTWLAIVWEVAWRSTALLALGLAAARIVPLRPARAHRVLLIAALACLAVQPASLVARRLDVGLFSRPPETRPAVLDSAPRQIPRRAVVAPSRNMVTGEERERPAQASTTAPAWGNTTTNAPRLDSSSLTVAFLVAWAFLTASGLLRLVVSFAVGLRLKARAPMVVVSRIHVAVETAARNVGLSVTPELRASPSVRCPVVWCWGTRPVQILPVAMVEAAADGCGNWAAVLCHELAHWKRADLLRAAHTPADHTDALRLVASFPEAHLA